MVLGIPYDKGVYLVPLNFVHEEVDNNIIVYFHGTYEGKKIELLRYNNKVSFLCYQDLGIKHSDVASKMSNYYCSLMADGDFSEITCGEEKARIISLLTKRYGFEGEVNLDKVVVDKTFIGKVLLTNISGKCNRRD